MSIMPNIHVGKRCFVYCGDMCNCDANPINAINPEIWPFPTAPARAPHQPWPFPETSEENDDPKDPYEEAKRIIEEGNHD